MSFPVKRVTNADTGNADLIGGDDWDAISDYFGNVDKTGPARINTVTQYRTLKLCERNPADTFSYIVATSAIVANRTVTEPLLTANDQRTYDNHATTLKNKTLDNTCDISALTETGVYDSFANTYINTTDNTLSPNKLWRMLYRGSMPGTPADDGEVGVRAPSGGAFDTVMYMFPYAGTYAGGLTSSSLQLTEAEYFADFDVEFSTRLVDQRKSSPNAWETGWFFFRFSEEDGTHYHHYYLILKTDGTIEMGRKDNVGHFDEQYFLSTGTTYTYALNVWNKVRVRCVGRHITVWVDDVQKIDMDDDGSGGTQVGAPNTTAIPTNAMFSGRFGFYNEDAEVEFSPMTIHILSYEDTYRAGLVPRSNIANTFTATQKIDIAGYPPLTLYREDSTVGFGNGIDISLQDSASAEIIYAEMIGGITSNTAAGSAQSGHFYINLRHTGALRTTFKLNPDGTVEWGVPTTRYGKFSPSGLTAARVFTFPDADCQLAGSNIANTFTAIQKISNSASGQPLTLYRGDNTAGIGEGIYFNLNTSTSAEATYALIYGGIEVNTNGAHRGDLYVQLPIAGSLGTRLRIYTSGNGGIIFGNNGRIQLDETNQTGAHAFTFPNETCALIGTDSLDVILSEGKDFEVGTSTGTKIATGTTQKLGFWNATPVAQQAANADTSGATLPNLEIEVNQIKQLLRNVGFMAP